MTSIEMFDANNRLLKQKVIDRVKQLPKLEINPTTVRDDAYTQPIFKLTTKQITNFKDLIK